MSKERDVVHELDIEIATQAEFEIDKLMPPIIENLREYAPNIPDDFVRMVTDLMKNSFIYGARWGLVKGVENILSKTPFKDMD